MAKTKPTVGSGRAGGIARHPGFRTPSAVKVRGGKGKGGKGGKSGGGGD